MTANTKMTEERAKQIYEAAVKERLTSWHGFVSGTEWKYASGFLDGLQAGRAEMAEECAQIFLRSQTKLVECKERGIRNPYIHEIVQEIRNLVQRDGGER